MDTKLVVRKSADGSDALSVMQLSGPVSLSTLFEFQNAVREDSAKTLIIDMTEVPYIDSAGIGSLVNAHVSRVNSGRKLLLAGAADRIEKILTVTGVFKVFSTFPTVDAAKESLH